MLINIFEQAPNIGVMHTGHGSHLYSSHSKHIDEAHFHPLNLFLLKKKKKEEERSIEVRAHLLGYLQLRRFLCAAQGCRYLRIHSS